MIDARNLAGAVARAERVARDNPGAPGSRVLLGDVLMIAGRARDAAAAYRAAADIRFDEPTMLRLVDALDRTGDRQEAARALALFSAQNPENVAAMRLTGYWQLAAGEFDDAVVTLEALRARIGDGDAALLAALANAHVGAGDAARAARYGEAAYAISPMNPAIADAYGWALFATGDEGGARQLIEKAVTIAPRNPVLRWHLAQVYAELGRRDAAREQARAALADPRFGDRAAAAALAA